MAIVLRTQGILESAQAFRAATTLPVNGSAGLIGDNFVLDWLAQSNEPVFNIVAPGR